MIFSTKIFGAIFLLLALTACSHTPESRDERSRGPASADTAAASEDTRDEFYKSLSAYRDGIAVSGYARVYSSQILKDNAEQEVAQPFLYYIALSSDFEIFVDGPDTLRCSQHSDAGAFQNFHRDPVVHSSPERTVQLFSIVRKEQPKLYPKIHCSFSGPAEYLDFKITVRFPQPYRRLGDEGELLRKMREHLVAGAQTLTQPEIDWIKKMNHYPDNWINLTPLNPVVQLMLERPDEFILLRLSSGAHMQPMEKISKHVTQLIAPSKGIHLPVSAKDLEFPDLKQNVVLCADSKDHLLIQGDRENEYVARGLQDSIKCLVNTPQGSPSRWKGKFVVNLMRVPVESLLQEIEAILRPQEIQNVEFDSEKAFEGIKKIQTVFNEESKAYPRTHYDQVYTQTTHQKPPAFEAVRHSKISE